MTGMVGEFPRIKGTMDPTIYDLKGHPTRSCLNTVVCTVGKLHIKSISACLKASVVSGIPIFFYAS